jgi:hypothetical protein
MAEAIGTAGALIGAAAAIAVEVTEATEAAAGIEAEAAAGIADPPDRDRSRRTAFLIVARQAAGL